MSLNLTSFIVGYISDIVGKPSVFRTGISAIADESIGAPPLQTIEPASFSIGQRLSRIIRSRQNILTGPLEDLVYYYDQDSLQFNIGLFGDSVTGNLYGQEGVYKLIGDMLTLINIVRYYLYNGTKLPQLPVYDSGTYDKAIILYHSDTDTYTLECRSVAYSITEGSSEAEVSNNPAYLVYEVSSDGLYWEQTHAGTGGDTVSYISKDTFVWANYTVLYPDETVYFEASELVLWTDDSGSGDSGDDDELGEDELPIIPIPSVPPTT